MIGSTMTESEKDSPRLLIVYSRGCEKEEERRENNYYFSIKSRDHIHIFKQSIIVT